MIERREIGKKRYMGSDLSSLILVDIAEPSSILRHVVDPSKIEGIQHHPFFHICLIFFILN